MKTKLFLLLFIAGSIIPNLLFAQFAQQGPKLVGNGSVGGPNQGYSVAISSDGNTFIEGGYLDNSDKGAAWTFTRSGGVWTQQGSKLVGTGADQNAEQGSSVAISSDGNTAVVGGPTDSSTTGAIWIFTRSSSVWTQQGPKLIGTNGDLFTHLGNSVAISSDGNTVIVGGYYDNNGTGAVWVFTRSGGVWTQQGSKLVGTGSVGYGLQGWSVSVSSDGNTAIEGCIFDNGSIGAFWIFTRTGGVWTQQGPKLVGTGAVGNAYQGASVAISSDGNTAICGGWGDNTNTGAVWLFTRSGGVWSQQGSKLIGTGSVGQSYQGYSVAITSNGNTIIEGGAGDNSNSGAVWVFTRSGGVWTQQGSRLVGLGAVGNTYQGTSVAISSNGNTAIVGGPADNNATGAVWIFTNPLVGITPISNEEPKSFSLMQNYPNPFNPSTNIRYDLPKNGFVKLVVFDELGREIETLVNEKQTAGTYEATFNGSSLSSGIYFYKLTAENFTETKKMLMIK